MDDIKILVLGDEINDKSVYYCGDIEIEAYKRYKELPSNLFKKIVKAKVKMCKIENIDFIEKYQVIERIK